MAEVKEMPLGTPSTNALDDIEVDLLEIPPAYYNLGTTPCAMYNPPKVGETRTMTVRVRCTGEHGPIERKDAEMRYTRTLSIQACWEKGQPEPPDASDVQPGLFDDGQDEGDPDASES
jgi:hypothetical protein